MEPAGDLCQVLSFQCMPGELRNHVPEETHQGKDQTKSPISKGEKKINTNDKLQGEKYMDTKTDHFAMLPCIAHVNHSINHTTFLNYLFAHLFFNNDIQNYL